MKSKLNIFIIIIFLPFLTFTVEKNDENNLKKEQDAISYLEKFKYMSYIPLFTSMKDDYIFEENNEDILTDADYIIEEDYFHDQADIDKKLDELIKNQASSFETINTEILVGELNKAYKDWEGTKYLWGGDSKRGIDCSAFVRRIYRKVFNYELPRVSTSQAKKGSKLKKSSLKPGDLIFFRPENRTNHIGIYLGNSLFIHSSSSRGVTISSLDNSYWNRYFKYGVRVNGMNLNQ